MKNILLLSLMVLFVSPVFAQTRPPKKIREAFEQMVPDAKDAKWSTPKERQANKDRKYTVKYTIEEDSLFSRYDYKANLIITVAYIPIEELPKEVVSSIRSDYMSAKIETAAKVKEAEFDGYGVIFSYLGNQWTVLTEKNGKVVLRRIKSGGF